MSPRSLLSSLVLAALILSGCTSNGGSGGGDTTITVNMTVTALSDARDEFRFSANGTKAGSPIVKYAWNFGDGEKGEGLSVEKKFERIDASYNVTLVVTDSKGNKGAAHQEIQVGQYANQAPAMGIKEAPRWVKPGTALSFDSSGSEDHDNDPIERTWIFGPFVEDQFNLTTPYMMRGNSSSLLFDRTGVYFMHCHPHPWMKMRVSVDPGASAPSNSTITIADFDFSVDNISVPPNTELTFLNDDPVPHTATLEGFHSGTIVGTSKTVSIPAPPEGKYQLWLFGDDRKGGVGFHAYGVQVSADAPTFTFAGATGGPLAQAGVMSTDHQLNEFTHNATVNASLTFTPVSSATVRLDLIPDAGGNAALSNQGSTSPLRLDGVALKGNYLFRVTVTAGAVQTYTLSATVTYLADPGFGEATSGGGHHH